MRQVEHGPVLTWQERLEKIYGLDLDHDKADDFTHKFLTPQDVVVGLPDPSEQGVQGFVSTHEPSFYNDVSKLQEGDLTAEAERTLFWSMNYCKWRAENLRLQLEHEFTGSPRFLEILGEIEEYWNTALAVRTRIVSANLRRIIKAGRDTGHGGHLNEYASYGNESLLRAVDSFEFTRGWRLSTYLHRTLYLYASIKTRRELRPGREVTNISEAELVTLAGVQFSLSESEEIRTRQAFVTALVQLFEEAELNDRQIDMVLERYGLKDLNEKTLKEIGDKHGVTLERTRQIIARALQKMHKAGKKRFGDFSEI